MGGQRVQHFPPANIKELIENNTHYEQNYPSAKVSLHQFRSGAFRKLFPAFFDRFCINGARFLNLRMA